MQVHGKRLTIQAVNDGFDLVYEGTMFQVLWEQEKRKNAFTWQNKNKRHDPFAVHEFGEAVDKVVAPTTREQGSKAAMQIQVMDREREARDRDEERRDSGSESPPSRASDNQEGRKNAIALLKKDKETTYNDLKAAIGQEEADEQIKLFMVSVKDYLYIGFLTFCISEWNIQAENGRDRPNIRQRAEIESINKNKERFSHQISCKGKIEAP